VLRPLSPGPRFETVRERLSPEHFVIETVREKFVIETVRERLSPEHFERYPVDWDRL
jgi:hypothetical protein